MGIAGTKEQKLTEEEKQLLRSSWEQVMKSRNDFAVEIFLRVFEADPTAQEPFDQLRGKSLKELRDHPMMKAHCLRIAAILNALLLELEEPATLTEMVKNIARTHFRYGNFVSKSHYDVFGKALIGALENQLKRKLDDKTKSAWVRGYQAMSDTLVTTKETLESGA